MFAEEDALSVVRGKLQVAGADSAQVRIVPFASVDGGRFIVPRDLGLLRSAIEEYAPVLTYVDALFNHLPSGIDVGNPMQVREAVTPLAAFAHEKDVTLLATMHENRGQRSASSKSYGSNEFRNVARSMLYVAKTSEDGIYAFAVSKPSYSMYAPTLTYRIVSKQVYDSDQRPVVDSHDVPFTVGKVVWQGTTDIGADELAMRLPVTEDQRAHGTIAVDFLHEALGVAARPAMDVCEEGRRVGIPRATIYRALKQAGVISERAGFPQRATWRLVDQSSQSSQSSHDFTLGRLETAETSGQSSRDIPLKTTETTETTETTANELPSVVSPVRQLSEVSEQSLKASVPDTVESQPPDSPPSLPARDAETVARARREALERSLRAQRDASDAQVRAILERAPSDQIEL